MKAGSLVGIPGSTESTDTQAYFHSGLQIHFSSVALFNPTLENLENTDYNVITQFNCYYVISNDELDLALITTMTNFVCH